MSSFDDVLKLVKIAPLSEHSHFTDFHQILLLKAQETTKTLSESRDWKNKNAVKVKRLKSLNWFENVAL